MVLEHHLPLTTYPQVASVLVRELAMAIRSGELSPVDHVEDVLKRLDGDQHNAVVLLLAEQARRAARERADELAKGQWRGPLHGIAVAVKDLIDVEGAPTKCGSNVRRGAPPAHRDAPVVARLRAAGAVVVAKTHTHEFAYGPTGDVAAEGPARNPHDPSRITGGSSSGSAAVVAAGHVPLALGTDTGCSARTPAALCGVVGLKPAYGRLPTDGVFPLSETCDHIGLLAADAHTASVGYDVLARKDGTGGGIQAPGVRGVVVGVPADPYWRALDPVITDAVDQAVHVLTSAGAKVVTVDTPGIDELAATYRRIVGAEAYTTHAHALATRRADFQPVTAQRLLASQDQPASDYVNAQRTRRRLAAHLTARLAAVDVLLTPTTPIRATPIGADTVPGNQPASVRAALLSLTLPFNLIGWPAVSVPVRPRDGGLPAGVQLVGIRFEERALLRVAGTLEQ
jgi:aspartyl-tRNA(Asn)/glutamyl-tRNA(Gln) amidotransferase subunit A